MQHRDMIAAAGLGLLINVLLAAVKFIAGIIGNSYALIADGVESSTDIVSSLFVWSGLRVSSLPPDADHPFGHGKAEPIAAALVSLMLIGAGIMTGIGGVRGALVRHVPPANFTLAVLILVVLVKEALYRRVDRIAAESGSHVIHTDAWHHRSDAISSAAAAVGILIALIGGPEYAAADDWAALVAAFLIVWNGYRLLRPAVGELMDSSPGAAAEREFRDAALSVKEVEKVEKLKVRKIGAGLFADIHVQMNGGLSLEDAHRVSGKVKAAFRSRIKNFQDCSIHMEPLADA